MRPRLTLLLSCLSLWAMACTKAPASPAIPVLTPERITVPGYIGFTRRTTVDFRLDGQALVLSEAEFKIVHTDEEPAFEVSFVPLSREVIISYSPKVEIESDVNLQLAYRGHKYIVPIHGVPGLPPECVQTECFVEPHFNPDADQCEGVPLSNGGCESVDCMNPGQCAAGVCVHAEVGHELAGCPQTAPTQQLTPAWVFALPLGSELIGPLFLDEDGNSYTFLYPSGEFVSFDDAGALRWRKQILISPSVGNTAYFDVKFSFGYVFVLDLRDGRLWVFDRVGGALFWTNVFGKPSRVLPVGDELWALVDVLNPAGSELQIFAPVTWAPLATVTPPQFVEGVTFVYDDLVTDEEGHVYLIGTKSTEPTRKAVVAMDAVTREPVWTTSFTLHGPSLSQPVTRSGSLLLFPDGTVIDVKTGEHFDNQRWQTDVSVLNRSLFAVNADGSGYRQAIVRGDCPTATLSHMNVQAASSDWACFLGSNATSGGMLQRTQAGSAVVMTNDFPGGKQTSPRLRIIDANGAEQFSGALTAGSIDLYGPPNHVFRGQRLVLRQIDSVGGKRKIVAYDIPELLTK